MTARDVIISAFASSARTVKLADGEKLDLKDFSQPLGLFTEEPILLDVPATPKAGEGFYDKAFSREISRYRDQDGSVLKRFLATRLVDVEVRRIALVGFSAGGTWLKGVLNGPDAAFVDSAIFLDAIHIARIPGGDVIGSSAAPLVNYGVRSAQAQGEWDGPMMVQAHTSIATPHPSVTSTTQSAEALTARILPNAPNAVKTGYDPDLLLGGPPPPAVSLGPSTGLPPPEKVFGGVPTPGYLGRGNYRVFDFGGTVGADHAFVTWFVQPGIWRALLAPRWNAGLSCPKPTEGLGQEFCGPGGIVVPKGTYPTPGPPNWPAAVAGLATGFAVGALAGRWRESQ